MKDSEARELILRKLYDLRRSGSVRGLRPDHFDDHLEQDEINRIVHQLYDMGLVRGTVAESYEGWELLYPEMTASGIDAVEGKQPVPEVTPPSVPQEESGERELDLLVETTLQVMIDPGSAPPEELADVLARLSILYRRMGGSGIDFSLQGIHMLEDEEGAS